MADVLCTFRFLKYWHDAISAAFRQDALIADASDTALLPLPVTSGSCLRRRDLAVQSNAEVKQD